MSGDSFSKEIKAQVTHFTVTIYLEFDLLTSQEVDQIVVDKVVIFVSFIMFAAHGFVNCNKQSAELFIS
ncbi:CLUMA_CG014810, isoform A [Clunio marinus]|uniref:CLUMA_CG014810, isoform A n=1 Tax=Clunio marinus TaxID=568069 RepID=A0A1J1IMN5_9DIPT|nr:CLUMA_CG014810, isoform A [Clunio marinus]